VVAAWEKAGFVAGWFGPHKKYGYLGYLDFSESLKELEASKAVPAFTAERWKPGMLEPLPAPTSAFGLYLGETDITDAGLKVVAKLQQLTMLVLVGTQITDAGLKEVAKLQQLTKLDLSYTQITDAGLKEVAKLQLLTWLNLSETQITGASLKELAKLQQLTSLNLMACREITDAGVAELKKALPKCEINR
jgi:Leucine-rich repeat (LRR) protein